MSGSEGGSVVEVDADSQPFGVLRIELSIGRGAAEVLRQYLYLAISDPRILELQARHDGAPDPPVTSRVGLKIGIRHRTNLAVPQGPRTGEFRSHLARATLQIIWISPHQHAPTSIDPKPGAQFIGYFQIHLFEAQIDSIDRSLAVDNKLIAQV